MITEIIEAIKVRAKTSERMSFVKSVRYGASQSLSISDQPALLYNFLGSNPVYAQSKGRTLELNFGFFVCSAITSTKEQAAIDAQNLYWFYADEAPRDRGLIPWFNELGNAPLFVDSAGRQWRIKMNDKKQIKIYADLAGQNVRGAVYAEAVVYTILDEMK